MIALMTDGQVLTLLVFSLVTIVTAFLYIMTENIKKVKKMKISRESQYGEKMDVICKGIADHPKRFSDLFELTYSLSLGNLKNMEKIVELWHDRARAARRKGEFAVMLAEVCECCEWWEDSDYVAFASNIISGIMKYGISRSQSPVEWCLNGTALV